MKTVLSNAALFTKPEIERAFDNVKREMVDPNEGREMNEEGEAIYSFYYVVNQFSHFLGDLIKFSADDILYLDE